MKFFPAVVLLLIFLTFQAAAQQPPFSPAIVSLPQLAFSACAWGDFDHDGDLDLALMGAEGNNPLTKIFRNDQGSFTDIQANLAPLHFGSVEWGDYDNDADLDLLATGIDILGTPFTSVYQNTGGAFNNTGVNLPGVMDGQACWGDLDNDGNLDILLAGSSLARIYRNDGNGQFTDVNAPFPGIETAMCCWNDYNNDGQQDVLVCGNTGGGIISKLFRNNLGVFTEVTISPEPFAGLYGGQAKWADLDNDGDQDLVISGMDLYVDGYFFIYRNDGNGHFTKFDQNTANLLNPTFDIGDYDGDGLADIVLMGTISGCGGAAVTMLLQNLGFISFFNVSTLLPGYKLGGVTWGDYNNDGFTDLLFTGLDAYEAPKTVLYLNNLGSPATFTTNTPPLPPQGLYVTTTPGQAILHWNSSSDGQTPRDALTYNIRIGTQPGSFEILSPLAVLNTGYRSVAAPGNTSADTIWTLTGILPGTYYFSVQSIDNGFMPGAFSTPCMFDFSPVGMREDDNFPFTISPNPCHDLLVIKDRTSAGQEARYSVFNQTGQLVCPCANPDGTDISTWPDGIYLVQKRERERIWSATFIKN